MTHKHLLVGTSLLSVVLLSVHLLQDALRSRPGTVEAGPGNLNLHNDAQFFVWGLIALGVNGAFSRILSVSELRRLRTERRMGV